MAVHRPRFRSVRAAEVCQPLKNDLRDLERYLASLEGRLDQLKGGTGLGDGASDSGNITVGKHAHTHASQRGSTNGSDPLDVFEFDWKRKHLFKPTSDEVPVTIDGAAGGQSADLLVMLPGAAVTAPTEIEDAFLWLVADDVAQADATDVTSWRDRVAGREFVNHNSTEPTFHTSVVNGHACVRKTGSANSVNGTMRLGTATSLAGAFTIAALYRPSASGAQAIIGNTPAASATNRGWVAAGQAASVNHSVCYSPDVGQVHIVSENFSDTGTYRVAILRRDTPGNHYLQHNGVDRTLASPYTNTNPFVIHGLFCVDNDSSPAAGFEIVELVAFNSFFSDAQVAQLFAYFNVRYALGLAASATTSTVFDNVGWLGVHVDPQVPLHVLDTGEQLRLGYDTLNYASFQVDSTGKLTITSVTSGGDSQVDFVEEVVITTTDIPQLTLRYDASNLVTFGVESDGDLVITPSGTSSIDGVGIGVSPAAKLHVLSTTEQLRLEHSPGEYISFEVTASGELAVTASDPSGIYFNTFFEVATTSGYQLLLSDTTSGTYSILTQTGGSGSGLLTFSGQVGDAFAFSGPVAINSTAPQLTLDDGGTGDAQFSYASQLLTITAPDINLVASGTNGVGINEASPDTMLHITGSGTTNPQFKIEHNGANYTNFQQKSGLFIIDVQSSGNLLQVNNRLFLGSDATQIEPSAALHVFLADTTVDPHANADDIVLELGASSGNYGISILRDSLGSSHIYFGDDLDNDRHRISSEPAGLTIQGDASSKTSKIDFRPNASATGAIIYTGGSANASGSFGHEFIDSTSRNLGSSAIFRNSEDSKELMKVGSWSNTSYVPGVVAGYSSSISGYLGALLSFNENDTSTGKVIRAGVMGSVVHNNSAVTCDRLFGLVGGVEVATFASSSVTTNVIGGVLGVAYCSADSNLASSKVIAGVVGRLSGASLTSGNFPPADPDTNPTSEIKGNWQHATCFWANAHTSLYYVGNPTNSPSILSSYKATVPEGTEGECWAYYSNDGADIAGGGTNYFYGAGSPTPSVGGALRAAWPRAGSRKTHIYFIPGSEDETTGNVQGDVYFDDGGSDTVVGLWEHDGTAWRKLVPQTDHTTTAGANAPTFMNVPGTGAAAQVGWMKVKIQDGAAGGRTGWIPYWQ